MDAFEVNLKQIVWDLESRVNPDTENIKKNIQYIGLTTPLLVVGPDKNDKYYLIDGSRRFNALKELSIYNQKYKKVPVTRIAKKVGKKIDREKIRFHLHNTPKTITGAEEQSAIEHIQEAGNYSDEEVIEIIQPKPARIKRMKKSREIDKHLRDEVSKKRASQHALEVIYNMALSKNQFGRLYNSLLNRKITGTDADALKKLDKDVLFDELSEQQKSKAIRKVLNQSRFTNKEARLIILSELMKENPNDYTSDSYEWINYLIRTMDKIEEMIHPDIQMQVTDLQKARFRSALTNLNNSLSWTWEKPYKNDQSRGNINETLDSLTSEETEKGYKFRMH
jgi:hypothetical protein